MMENSKRLRWEYKIEVSASAEHAQSVFFEEVWKKMNGGIFTYLVHPKIVEEGDENGVGNTRSVPFLHEKILEARPGEIIYTVSKGYFPANYHRGMVTFVELSPGNTEVTWAVDIEPYRYLKSILHFTVASVFQSGLNGLKAALEKESE
mmetsp:Transcript_4347/g.5046  ORF Transcript_4347/g.5046 Transcript_4347/m.5046 type:complete len:149 (-) Transcript_4347:223-669(-)